MRHAILILAHRYPQQVGRLCDKLRHPDLDIYIHVDAKSRIEGFQTECPVAIFIKNRCEVTWGRFSMVKACINSAEEILANGKQYGHILFISGQDYPIIPIGNILKALEAAPGNQYLEWAAKNGDSDNERNARARYKVRHYRFRSKKITRLVNRLMNLLPSPKPPFTQYMGSNWWDLTSDCVRYVVEFSRKNPKVNRFYQHTDCPDEFYFQSILMHSPYCESIVNRSNRYIDWTDPVRNPKILTSYNYDEIAGSGKWFARKIDMEVDTGIIDMLDRKIEKERART